MYAVTRVRVKPCRYCGQRTPRDACADCLCELAEHDRLCRLETQARPVTLALTLGDRMTIDELGRDWAYLWAIRLWLAIAVGDGHWYRADRQVYQLTPHDAAFIQEGANGDIRRGRRSPATVWPEVYARLPGLLPAWRGGGSDGR